MNYESISLKIIENSMMKCTHTVQHVHLDLNCVARYQTKQDACLAKWFLQSSEPNVVQNIIDQKKYHGYYHERYNNDILSIISSSHFQH